VNHAWALSLSTGICLCLCKFLSICVAVHWILLLKMSSLFMRYMVCWPRRNYQIDQKINECSFLFCRLTARWLMWLVFLWYVSQGALYFGVETLLLKCETWLSEAFSPNKFRLTQIQKEDLIQIWKFGLDHGTSLLFYIM
jgi:hypothetical protein